MDNSMQLGVWFLNRVGRTLVAGALELVLLAGCSDGETFPFGDTDTASTTPEEARTPADTPDDATITPMSSTPASTAVVATPTPIGQENPTLLPFPGTELLGRPTDGTITISTLAGTDLELYVEYGVVAGQYTHRTETILCHMNEPLDTVLSALEPDTRYFYRTRFRESAGGAFLAGDAHTFHTQRKAGAGFTFTVQADSHLDYNSSLELYSTTLTNVLLDRPDFHIDLGDTFMCEKYSEPFSSEILAAEDYQTVEDRYVYERTNFGLLSHSVPLYLVNGNHEGENGWLLDGTNDNLAIWTATARQKFYLNPVPDRFYSGDAAQTAWVGQRASYYAWEWGDALFVVIDPFWNTETNPRKTGAWAWTLGEEQYIWFRDTLESSKAHYKFVFTHHLLGGVDDQARGGIEAAPYYEWGGMNADGSWGFDSQRPGWGKSIHALMVENGVSVLFHGHDHVFVKQELDGVVYQELPQPSSRNYNNGDTLAAEGGYVEGVVLSSSGHLRVTVSESNAAIDYVRAFLPEDENGTRKNGQVAYSYQVGKRQKSQGEDSIPEQARAAESDSPCEK